jgi:hypothetical protein
MSLRDCGSRAWREYPAAKREEGKHIPVPVQLLMMKALLGLLLLLWISVPSAAVVDDYLGFYHWTATYEFDNATASENAIPFPSPNSGNLNAIRIFTRSDEPGDVFFLKGSIAKGNEFVVTLSLQNVVNGSIAVTEDVFVTTYEIGIQVKDDAIAFENQVVPIASTVNSIQVQGENLQVQGPDGIFEGVRTADPLETTTSDGRQRGGLTVAVGSAILVSISGLILQAMMGVL